LEKRGCDCVSSKELNAFKVYTYILIGLLIFSYMFLAIYFMNGEEYEGLIINFINNNSNVYKNVKNKGRNIKNKNYNIYKNIPVNYIKKKIN